ncbi:MAG: hypothetical protein KatS3mg060_0076 [Dehalococcoidia bacterium]|jgi:peroxiredoxin Q/BCP|nr:MAG: hypothetical protein KatS3mg060_0076 [Dehalococcoidia bacterium]
MRVWYASRTNLGALAAHQQVVPVYYEELPNVSRDDVGTVRMRAPIQPGDQAPDFRLPSTAGEITGSEIWRDAKLVLAFYTEDGTPACQAQVQALAEDLPMLEDLGARVIAISADPLDSHTRFAERLGGAPYPLASDPHLEVAHAYGVADDELKRSRRAVFVIDRGGTVIHANPWFVASSPEQRLAILEALGAEL